MEVFNSILPIFFLVVIGNVIRRTGIVPMKDWRGLELICFWLFFPAILCITLATVDLQNLPLGPLSITVLAVTGIMWAILFALKPVLHSRYAATNAQFTSIFQVGSRFHGFVALAIVLKLYGETGAAYVAIIMALLVPPINIVNIGVLAAFGEGQTPSIRNVARIVTRNPIIWGAFIGLTLNFTGLGIWEPLYTTLDLLGSAALGAGLLAVGAGLRVKAALRPSVLVWTGVLARLVVTPLLVLLLALATGLSGEAFEAAMICAAVPTAMNGYVLARTMGGDADLYAATTTVQTALSFGTIPLVIWLSRHLPWLG